jgi:CheY-like chemotaxis protein
MPALGTLVAAELDRAGGELVDDDRSFGANAQKLARNPLGIIALFIVLVYGVAGLVTAFSASLSPSERIPLVYFLVVFPVLVLGVFAWLVSQHSNKLFSPTDFKDEANYVKMLSATASLAVASVKTDSDLSTDDIGDMVRTVRESADTGLSLGPYWRNNILWVDDRPDNNVYERRAFEAMGISFTLVESTAEALEELRRRRFAAIISDMGRREGPREGYALLDQIRKDGNQTPLFFYASSNSAEHRREAAEHGGQGATNNAQELFRMVMRSVLNR